MAKYTVQGMLDLALNLQAGISRDEVIAVLDRERPLLRPQSRKVALSQLMLMTNPRVREQIGSILAHACKRCMGKSFVETVFWVARHVQKGQALP